MEMKNIVLGVVGIVVAFTLIQAIVPQSVSSISNTSAITDYDTWGTGTQNMYEVIPVFGVLALLLLIIGVALKAVD